MPSPPEARSSVVSAWWNSSKTWEIFAGSMPMPLS
jgi:hypothetical protein